MPSKSLKPPNFAIPLHFCAFPTSDSYIQPVHWYLRTTHNIMTNHPIISTLLIGLLLPTAAFAMPPGPPPPPSDPVAEALDKDHDHELSSWEIKKATKALLKLDEDEDNALSEEELRPEPPRGERRRKRDDDAQGQAGPPPPSPLFKAIDTDGDGMLSEAEINGATEALLKLDIDEDGELSSAEAGLDRQDGPQGTDGPPPGGPRGPGGPPPGGPRR